MQIVLASGSPRRQELLAQLGYQFTTQIPDIEELQGDAESAFEYVERLAKQKAAAGGRLFANEQLESDESGNAEFLVIGSDTVVVKDDVVFEKPADLAHSQRILQSLSGHTHQVMTAVCVAQFRQNELFESQSIVVVTDVTFKTLTTAEIEHYWQTGEPQDKAGSYGIQGIGGKFVTHLNGSYHAVMGLPLYETNELLQNFLKG